MTFSFNSSSSTGSALSARRSARESRVRPWLVNSILARKCTAQSCASGSGPLVSGDAPSELEEKSSDSPVISAGDVTLVPSSSEESILAEKATVGCVVASAPEKVGCFSTLRALANSMARTPSRIPRLRTRFASSEETIKSSHAAALSEGHVSPSSGSGSGSLSRPHTGVVRGVSLTGWFRRAIVAVSSSERKLKKTIAGGIDIHPKTSSRVPVCSRSVSAVLRAGLSSGRGLVHKASPSWSLAKATSTQGSGVSSGSLKPKKSILKVKDPPQNRMESCVRPLLGRVKALRRRRVHFDGYPVTFVSTIVGSDDYDRTSIACWKCNLNWETDGGHDEDCTSFDVDPWERGPSRADWEQSQKRLREAHDEALAMASGGSIKC